MRIADLGCEMWDVGYEIADSSLRDLSVVRGPLSQLHSANCIALKAQGAGLKAQGKSLVVSSSEELDRNCFSPEFWIPASVSLLLNSKSEIRNCEP